MQVHPVQVIGVLHEVLHLLKILWSQDHAHVRKDVLPPFWDLPVVLQLILVLQLPTRATGHEVLVTIAAWGMREVVGF